MKSVVITAALLGVAGVATTARAQSQPTQDYQCMSLKNGDIALSVFDYYKTYPIVSENNYINPVRYTVKNSTDLSVDLTIDLYYAAQQTTFTVDVSATIVEGRMLLIKNTVNGEATDSFSVSFCGGQEIQSTAPDSST